MKTMCPLYVEYLEHYLKTKLDPNYLGFMACHERVLKEGPEALNRATEILLRGGVVAIPTDTIYGICCLAENTDAVSKIYKIKGRDFSKPLAICVEKLEDFSKCVQVGEFSSLLFDLLPGGITVVLPRCIPDLNPHLNPSCSTLGVRIPDHQFVLDLCRSVGKPIALTSANKSNTGNSVQVQDFQDLWEDLDLTVDGGHLGKPQASTVFSLSVTDNTFIIIREGRDCDKVQLALQRHGLQ